MGLRFVKHWLYWTDPTIGPAVLFNGDKNVIVASLCLRRLLFFLGEWKRASWKRNEHPPAHRARQTVLLPESFDLSAPPSCSKDASSRLASPLLSYARIHGPAVLLVAPLPCPPGLCTYPPSFFFFFPLFIYFRFFVFYYVLANWVIDDLWISPFYFATHVIDSDAFFFC